MTAGSSVLWVNGPFGGGKTSACRALRCLDPRWRLADPEILGSFLRDAEASHGQDYQNHPGWIRLVVAGLVALDPSPERPVAVPMSIHHEQTWDAIEADLTRNALGCTHVVLDSCPTVIARRIASAYVFPGEEAGCEEIRAFRMARLAVYHDALGWLRRKARVINSTLQSPSEVASEMLNAIREP